MDFFQWQLRHYCDIILRAVNQLGMRVTARCLWGEESDLDLLKRGSKNGGRESKNEGELWYFHTAIDNVHGITLCFENKLKKITVYYSPSLTKQFSPPQLKSCLAVSCLLIGLLHIK